MIDLTTRPADADTQTLIMEISGRADTLVAQFLFDCIQGHVESGYSNIILDCSGLQSISSRALGELIRANRCRGVSLSLVAVPGKTAEILRITHVNRLLDIFDTVEAAVESMQEAVV